MSVGARRRRGLVLLCLALVCGGVAASQVRDRVRQVEGQVGPLVPVVVAKRDLKANTELSEGSLEGVLAVRQVPERFAPRDSFASPDEAAGLRTAGPVAAGAYLTVGQLQVATGGQGERSGGIPRGERAVEVAVAGAGALGAVEAGGGRVDVLVSTERDGSGRTFLALENVELLALRGAAGADGLPGSEDVAAGEGSGAGGVSGAGQAVATLRVTLPHAVYLTAAQNFAREVRLLPRPPGDHGRAGRQSVSAAGL